MIVSIVTFKLPRPWSVEDAAKVFRSTAPKYLGKAGLVRKHYYVTEAGDRAGGIYLWKSKADAEACYTGEWRAMEPRILQYRSVARGGITNPRPFVR